MKKFFLFLIFASFSVIFSISSEVLAQTDPQIQWKIIKLPHFDLIFDAKHQELAFQYAAHLEEINQTLGLIFSESPEKTLLVINDRTDLTNGYATAIPQSTIMVFPVLPGPLESIYEHGDWSRELIMHEYTHILSFEPRRGVVKVLRSIFGSIITPNILLPRWWLEGIAVEMETRQTSFGRLRSSSQDAALRSFVVDNTLEDNTLSQINEVSIPSWPAGARPYLFGSLMWSQMIYMSSIKTANDLPQRYGGRFPFFLDGPATDSLGTNYLGVFKATLLDLENRVHLQLSILKKINFSQGEEFKSAALEYFSPFISSDGLKMAYITKDETTKRSIKILKRPSKDVRFSESQIEGGITQELTEQADSLKTIPPTKDYDGPPAGTISRMSWYPDSQKFLFDKVDEFNRYHEASDLWIYDLETKKSKQLTKGLRAREAAVSLDGKTAAFIKLGAGSTALSLIDLETGLSQDIYTPPLLSTISFPVYLTADELVFGERTKDGLENLKKIKISTRNVEVVLKNFKNAKVAVNTSLGLIFSSTQNGVSNLYLADQNLASAKALTHSATAVTLSDYDSEKKELYITELSSKGQHLRILPQSEWTRVSENPLPTVTPLFSDRYVENSDPHISNPSGESKIEDYSPSGYLWPKYWLPGFVVGSKGSYLAASTSQSDPVGLHSYSISVGYDTYLQEANYNLIYQNNTTDATLIAEALDFRTPLGISSLSLRNQTQALQANWQLSGISTELYSGLGWGWSSYNLETVKSYQTGPSLQFMYSNFTQAGEQISPESGWGGVLKSNFYLRGEPREGYNEILASMTKYHSKWLPKRHALMLKIQGRWIEDQVSLPNYNATLAYPLVANSPLQQYLMRGYPTGTFFAKSLANYNVEYRFPIWTIYQGHNTFPFFLKRFHGAVVADGISLDGFAFNEKISETFSFRYEAVPKWKTFWDTGLEIKADITLGYHFPLTIYSGYYTPLDKQYGQGEQFALGILL